MWVWFTLALPSTLDRSSHQGPSAEDEEPSRSDSSTPIHRVLSAVNDRVSSRRLVVSGTNTCCKNGYSSVQRVRTVVNKRKHVKCNLVVRFSHQQ